MEIVARPSPNFNARDEAVPLRHIVLHYTGMESAASALARLCDPASDVSAHYVVDEDGRVFALVDEAQRAWHAGRGFWRGVRDMNSASVGIELVNPGHAFGYRAFPATQIAALLALMRDVVARWEMDGRQAPLAHADFAPVRKADPGELFPWQDLAAAGFGVWPQPQAADYAPQEAGELRRRLAAWGYDPALLADEAGLQAVLLAFQRRFAPEELAGGPGMETLARLRALGR